MDGWMDKPIGKSFDYFHEMDKAFGKNDPPSSNPVFTFFEKNGEWKASTVKNGGSRNLPKSFCANGALAATLPKEKVDSHQKALTVKWIQAMFKRYYEKAELRLPPRFARREYGFMFYDSDMVQRHLGFASSSEVKEYLVTRIPAHAYHSAAYYEKPGAPTMDQKGWLGADLIFDLDADHIERVKGMPYEQMLEEVKSEIKKIVDQFLLGDYGFDEKSIAISFSGGRGYHIHVRDSRVWALGPHERREIVDYITGTDLDPEAFVRPEVYDVSQWGAKYRYTLPMAGESGWRRRIRDGIIEVAQDLEARGRDDAIKYLMGFSRVSRKTAEVIYDTLFKPSKGKRGIDKLRDGWIDIFESNRFLTFFKQITLQKAVDLGKRETDEPVTSDVKRLIRLVSSLHGRTGMMVVSMTRDDLDDFRPLRDAFPSAFREDPVKVDVIKPVSLALRGETFNLSPGVTEVPEYAAVFLSCRGLATIPQVSP